MIEIETRRTGKRTTLEILLTGLAWLAIAIGIGYSCAHESVSTLTIENCAKSCAPGRLERVTDSECSCRMH